MKQTSTLLSKHNELFCVFLSLAAIACSAENTATNPASNLPYSAEPDPPLENESGGNGGSAGLNVAGNAYPSAGFTGTGAAGDNTSGNPGFPFDDETCGEATIEPVIQLVPGNLMVIFDRSASMNEWFVTNTRIHAAYFALLEGLQPFVCAPDNPDCEEQLNVAAILLPSSPGGVGQCYVEDINSPQQINWMGATQFVAAWQTFWNANPDPDINVLVLGTPILPAFEHAANAIATANLPGKTAVLFLTDGLGTCGVGTPADVQAAEWLNQGIRTHVVSISSISLLDLFGMGQVFNDGVAAAGGTGQSIYPEDVASLNTAFSEIIESASASPGCEVKLQGGDLIDLDQACERGTVTVGGEPIVCDQQNRTDGFWVKSTDQIELVGSACEKLQAEGQLSASFPCDVILLE